MTDPDDGRFELLAVLLSRTGNQADVTWDEIADARRRLAEGEWHLVTYPIDQTRSWNAVRVELRSGPSRPRLRLHPPPRRHHLRATATSSSTRV